MLTLHLCRSFFEYNNYSHFVKLLVHFFITLIVFNQLCYKCSVCQDKQLCTLDKSENQIAFVNNPGSSWHWFWSLQTNQTTHHFSIVGTNSRLTRHCDKFKFSKRRKFENQVKTTKVTHCQSKTWLLSLQSLGSRAF